MVSCGGLLLGSGVDYLSMLNCSVRIPHWDMFDYCRRIGVVLWTVMPIVRTIRVVYSVKYWHD